MYTNDIVGKGVLIVLSTQLSRSSSRAPEWLKRFVGHRSPNPEDKEILDTVPEVDYNTCKRIGISYGALPKTMTQQTCSGTL